MIPGRWEVDVRKRVRETPHRVESRRSEPGCVTRLEHHGLIRKEGSQLAEAPHLLGPEPETSWKLGQDSAKSVRAGQRLDPRAELVRELRCASDDGSRFPSVRELAIQLHQESEVGALRDETRPTLRMLRARQGVERAVDLDR